MTDEEVLANCVRGQVAGALASKLSAWNNSAQPLMAESEEFRVTLNMEPDGDITLTIIPLLAGLRPHETMVNGTQLTHEQWDAVLDYRLRCRRTHQHMAAKSRSQAVKR